MNAFWIKYLPGILRARLDGRHLLQQAVGNTGWLMLEKVLRILIGLVISIWMARVLGPLQFGQFNYALAYVALFSSIATLGLDGITVRNLVHTPDARDLVLGSVFMLKIAGALLAIVLCMLSIFFVEPDNRQMQVLVLLFSLGLLFQPFDVIDFWFQSRVKSKFTVLAKLPALFFFFGVRAYLLLGAASLTALAWAHTLEVMMAAIGLVIAYWYVNGSITKWRPAFAYALSLIKESWPLILAGLSILLYMKIDIVMLGRMSSDTEVGLYSAASKLSEGLYFVPMIVTSSLAPLILRARASSHIQYMQSMLKLYVLMVRLSLAIAIPLAILSPFLVEVFFGNDYLASAPILRVHIWAMIAVFLSVASSQYLINEGQQKISLYRTLIGLIVNIALNLWLIPIYGGMGAAIATLISYFMVTFSICITRSGAEQGRLILRAMNPAVIFGLKVI